MLSVEEDGRSLALNEGGEHIYWVDENYLGKGEALDLLPKKLSARTAKYRVLICIVGNYSC